jgi:hypothetical protein
MENEHISSKASGFSIARHFPWLAQTHQLFANTSTMESIVFIAQAIGYYNHSVQCDKDSAITSSMQELKQLYLWYRCCKLEARKLHSYLVNH